MKRILSFFIKRNFCDKKNKFGDNYDINALVEPFTETISEKPVAFTEFMKENLLIRQKTFYEQLENKIKEGKNEINLPNMIYKEYMKHSLNGHCVNLKIQNKEIIFVSTPYQKVDLTNLYRMMNYVNPDIVITQSKMDLFNNNFYEDLFDEEKDIKDHLTNALVKQGSTFQPSLEHKNKSIENLKNKNIRINKSLLIDSNHQNNIVEKIKDRLDFNTVSMISLWAELKNKDMGLIDYPFEFLLRYILTNVSLNELKNIFSETYSNLYNFKEIKGTFNVAMSLYPDLFLNVSDKFMSYNLNNLLQNNKYRKYLVFCGYGQSISLPIHLNYNKPDIYKMTTELSMRYNNFIGGEDSLEFSVEKLVLSHLILYGLEYKPMLEEMEDTFYNLAYDETLKTGYKNKGFLVDRMNFLYHELYKERKEQAIKLMGEGLETRKRKFLEKIFNNPNLNSELI